MDDGVLEQSALFEVADEAGGAAGHAAGKRAVVAFDILVAVPVAAEMNCRCRTKSVRSARRAR